jgi:Xaa-Pro aminopeptidase
MNTIANRLAALRQLMQRQGIAACIIPSSDPHLSEYVAAHWKRREWISGFDGSAGTVVVLQGQAGLWTDSRYFLQAEMQLKGSGISLFREGLAGVPDYLTWLISNLPEGAVAGIDGAVFSTQEAEGMKLRFSAAGLTLKADFAPFDEPWVNLPPLSENDVFIYDEKFAGISCSEKIRQIRQKITEAKADGLLLTGLDEVAWTFNIRGTDVEYNPVTIAYAMIATGAACIFIDEKKLPLEVVSYFNQYNINVFPYAAIFGFLEKLPASYRMLIDKQKVNFALFDAISGIVIEKTSPVTMLKSIKNKMEITGTKNAVLKDGIALVRAFYRLEKELCAGRKVTELSFAGKLSAYRAEQKDFFSESFPTITGYAAKGAIVHCITTPENDTEIRQGNLFLVDSGGNYLDGTTDITRTIAVGKPTEQQKRDYTNLLKGHIALASAKFPEGTHGVQLDAFARQFLWNECLNYGHGTGHGIGHFLSVHEGPQNIRIKDNGVELKPGMLLSNEPGLYRTGEYGIRLENMMLVKTYRETQYGRFLEFETLSLFPFDLKLIEINMLSRKELEWLNDYHQTVSEKLSPFLTEEEKNWLGILTHPLHAGADLG